MYITILLKFAFVISNCTYYYKNHTSNERQYSNSIFQNDNNLHLETEGQETAYVDDTLCLIVYTCK
jgi:hypothetical protein